MDSDTHNIIVEMFIILKFPSISRQPFHHKQALSNLSILPESTHFYYSNSIVTRSTFYFLILKRRLITFYC